MEETKAELCTEELQLFTLIFEVKRTSDMSEVLRDTDHKGNCIPSGRHLDFCDEDSNDHCEEPQQNTEVRAETVHYFSALCYQTVSNWYGT